MKRVVFFWLPAGLRFLSMRKRGKALNGGSHFFPCCSVCVTNRFVNDQQIDIITRHLIRRESITSLVMKEGRSVIGGKK